MLYEFAVEPACLDSWQTFRYLIEKFGVSHGRLISRFPKDWIRKVMEHCSCGSFTFVQKQRLEIEMKRIRQYALIRSGRDYENSISWMENAIAQHIDSKPFHAIIVKKALQHEDYLLEAEDISHNVPIWAVPRERKIQRSVDALSDAVEPLLKISNRILFVDKMFRTNPFADRWKATLESFLKRAVKGRENIPSLEYHFEFPPADFGIPVESRREAFQKEADEYLQEILPQGVSLKLHRWTRRHDQSDFFHGRYILTERGGIRIDWGLDQGRSGETTDITLMDDGLWQEYWESFQDGVTVFQLIDSVVVEGKGNYA
jgi:hypothetical protein